jgi:hypothetical protein
MFSPMSLFFLFLLVVAMPLDIRFMIVLSVHAGVD